MPLLAFAATLAMVGCGGGGGGSLGSQTMAPAVSLSATSLSYTSQTDGTTSAAQTITVTNSGNAALVISGVTFSGTNAGDFAQTNDCSSVAAAGTCTVNVTFTPITVGGESGTLSIASNAASSPNTVSLVGTGASSGATTNTVAGLVDAGPAALANPALNILYVSVTICAPGSTTNCQVVDHMQVDTGSTGVRVLSEVLNTSLAAALTAKTTTAGAGHSLVECTQFGDGYSWGPIKSADVTIGGKSVAGVSIQVIGDSSVPASLAPANCLNGPGGPTEEDTVAAFGANGIVGLSVFLQDCGSACPGDGTAYADCTASACAGYAAALTEQLPNPVGKFATDNNGVVIQLPPVTGAGGTNVAGTLVFGVATQANNAIPGTATVFTVDTGTGEFGATLSGNSLPHSFIDSGSNGYFFPNVTTPTLATCASPNTSFYCPATDTTIDATITGTNSATHAANFTVQNLNEAGATVTAFGGLAGNLGTFASSLDFGLPFFFGRSVFVIFEQSTAGSATGPAVAF